MIDARIRYVRWQAQEQAVAILAMQAQVMAGKPKEQPVTRTQDAPKRKAPIATMDDFIKSME